MDRVVVRVPATIANLGPGFDVLGLAIGWHNEVRVERIDEGLALSATGVGSDGIPKGAANPVVRAIGTVLGEVPPLSVHQMVAIPLGRGFGSSAAAIVGGLFAGRALGETSHTDEQLLEIAIGMEGHADNVAPCVLGGITVSSGGRTLRLEPPKAMRPLVCVAPSSMATGVARAALPVDIPRADAVENIGRAALLVAAMAGGRTDTLMEATEDRLHQPRRFELMPDSGALVRALRAKGVAAFLAGAGPSVAALVDDGAAAEAEAAARGLAPSGWEVRLEKIDPHGATVVASR
ncbi:MAG: homoserine kinase [Actinomycetota bacterium]